VAPHEHYKQFYNVGQGGTWHEWRIYFLNGVALQPADVLFRAKYINELLSQWKITIASTGS
jgi:hypothetical protein